MNGIAIWRVNLLRAGYLLIVLGLGLVVWPSILNPAKSWEPAHGVIAAMLAALSLLSLLGVRSPLRMLPILLWEIGWKIFWLTRVALPLWLGGGHTGHLLIRAALPEPARDGERGAGDGEERGHGGAHDSLPEQGQPDGRDDRSGVGPG